MSLAAPVSSASPAVGRSCLPTAAAPLRLVTGLDSAPGTSEDQGCDLDAAAEPHLRAWRRGEITADDLRRNLATLIAGCDVPLLVAHRAVAARPGDPRLREDLAEQLRTLLVDKMLPPSTTFDPERAGSVRGWAWNFASAAAGFQHRDLTRFYARFRLLATGEWNGLDSESGPLPPATPALQPSRGQVPSSTVPFDDPDRCAAVAEAVTALGRAGLGDPHLQAEALLAGLGLPEPRRLTRLEDRERLQRQLSRDPTLARRSLVAWLRTHRAGITRPGDEDIDPMLMGVWDRFDVEQVCRLASCSTDRTRRDLPAHVVALSAVSPRPRPASKRIRSFVAAVVARAGVGDDIVRDTAAAYVEAECEPVARRATTLRDIDAVLERHARLRRGFDRLLREVAVLESDLGTGPEDIHRELARLAYDEGLLFRSRLRARLQAVHAPDHGTDLAEQSHS
jgi:hypothetical protein